MQRRKDVFVGQALMYALTEDKDGVLYLEVARGGIAMETVVIPLNA